MAWSQRPACVARRGRNMEARKVQIQSGLDRGDNRQKIAADIRMDKGELSDYIVSNQMVAFSDLGFQRTYASDIKNSGGHYGKHRDIPLIFKKREGWYCIVKAYKIRSYMTAAQVAEQEVVKLQAEVASLKALIEEGQGGVP